MLVRLGKRARLGLQLALSIGFVASALGNYGALAKHDHDDRHQATHQWDAELTGLPPKTDKHRHPLIKLVKGVGHEAGYDVTNVVRDSVFVFSAQDIDPYDHKTPPKNSPYTLATFNLVDGSEGNLVKYPDGSGRVFGGYINGTLLIPDGDHRWIVKYPNGVQGVMRRLPNGNIEVARPDKTITTFTREGNGNYRVANDHIGYMGDVNAKGSGFNFSLK